MKYVNLRFTRSPGTELAAIVSALASRGITVNNLSTGGPTLTAQVSWGAASDVFLYEFGSGGQVLTGPLMPLELEPYISSVGIQPEAELGGEG